MILETKIMDRRATGQQRRKWFDVIKTGRASVTVILSTSPITAKGFSYCSINSIEDGIRWWWWRWPFVPSHHVGNWDKAGWPFKPTRHSPRSRQILNAAHPFLTLKMISWEGSGWYETVKGSQDFNSASGNKYFMLFSAKVASSNLKTKSHFDAKPFSIV